MPTPVLTPAGLEPAFDLRAYYPVLLFAGVILGMAVGIVAASQFAHLLRLKPWNPTRTKQMPYESGMDPVGSARMQFDVRFYLIAILFLVFDVELLFLYPWAVTAYGEAGGGGVAGCLRRGDLRRNPGLPGDAGRRLRLRLEEGGVPVAVKPTDSLLVAPLDYLASWVRKHSLWPMPFATACCGIELMATASSRYDIARFGSEAMRFSPRQCDVMIVAGRVVMKMVPVMQRIWQQMSEPKWCISMGACASSGGVFDTYAVVQGIDRFIPVDVLRARLPAAAGAAHPGGARPSGEGADDRHRERPGVRPPGRLRGTDPTGPGAGPERPGGGPGRLQDGHQVPRVSKLVYTIGGGPCPATWTR